MTKTKINIQREKDCTMYDNQNLAIRVYDTEAVTLIYRVAPETFSTVSISREQGAKALRDMREASK
ncbi:hypothetical protein OAG04_00425 [bacterium]|nr:hypothetical protein [bacterium]